MRILLISFAVFILCGISSDLNAQSLSIKINIESQPVWGPTGYDYVEYYYFPDIEVYYYVPSHRYYYFHRGRWINGTALPVKYRHLDLYKSYKVVINEPHPWRNHKIHKEKYVSFRGRHDQEVIRNSRDSKYFVNKRHPEHKNWLKQQKHENRRNEQKRMEEKSRHRERR